ncbi:MAG: TIGR03986 family CRISPR-associated RAMP protein, partial [Synergistaceae bacterium]|nr:TIGR03986 family CRISPR-associated RAMP protein [Synergistaceae bacterium]
MAFHNPYNFVPTCDREKCLSDPFAGDHDPSVKANKEDHSRYHEGRYTGTIPVVLSTITPLFITDPSSKVLLAGTAGRNDAHYCYDTLDYIPATALKGLISSAYEAITNSRYRVFSKRQHTKKLGMRAPATPNLVPGRVRVGQDTNSLEVELFTGTVRLIGANPDPLYAAWLPMYTSSGSKNEFLNKLNGEHKTDVKIRLYQHYHYKKDKDEQNRYVYVKDEDGNPKKFLDFKFWSVVEIAGKKIVGTNECPTITKMAFEEKNADGTAIEKSVEGYIVISGKTFKRKHDERFFFNAPAGSAQVIHITPAVQKSYEELISNYQSVHEGGANPTIDKGVIHGKHIMNADKKTLRDGDFVYVNMNSSNTAVVALFPVQISRELHEKTPWDCAYPSVRPAEGMDNLSPADRLFGWVNQNGKGAWKGKIRISDGIFHATEEVSNPTEQFEPLPLAILGNPKPAQARFYLGDAQGAPQNCRIKKADASYRGNKKLRGRKVYLHQLHGESNYWNAQQALAERQEHPEDREYVMNDQYVMNDRDDTVGTLIQQSGQNRSISSWISPERLFRFDMRVENLTREELGALLQLLAMTTANQERCFKLGFAKPLGLGSVTLKLDMDDSELLPVYTGKQHASDYRGFGELQTGIARSDRRSLINAYKKSMVDAYGTRPNAAPPAIPDSWRGSSFGENCIDETNVHKFEAMWTDAFENNAVEFSIDQFEGLSADGWNDLAGDAVRELNDLYLVEQNAYRTAYEQYCNDAVNAYANAWIGIPFIDAFRKSMEGYENVHYPRNWPLQLGYEWFSHNEDQTGGQPRYAFSLPE